MQSKIKRTLIIIPIIFCLCFSFIGVNVSAATKVDDQSNKNITSEKVEDKNSSKEVTSDKDNQYKTKANSESDKDNNSLDNDENSQDKNLNDEKTADKNENYDLNKDNDLDNGEQPVEENLPEWRNIAGKLQYFTKDGLVKETGWFMEKDENPDADNENKYYLDKNHSAVIGWKEIDDQWYYFNEAGVMQTGWKLINYNWYYLNEDGIMQTGWVTIDRDTYYLRDDGVMYSGKKNIDGKWYFFGSGGILQTGQYFYNGKIYYSSKDGEIISNKWVTTKTRKMYIKADGSMATGDLIINGKLEHFSDSGAYEGPGDMKKHLYIKYLNVGNADCAFIKLPSGETALIDTGDIATQDKLVEFLKNQDLKEKNGKGIIDYVILTHAHSDHIGGLAAVLDNFKVKNVYLPEKAKMQDWFTGVKVTSENSSSIELLKSEYKVYEDMLKALEEHDLDLIDPEQGEYVDKNNILQFIQSDKNYGPIGSDKILEDYWGLNDNSAIVYLNYGDLQALFTGDMEWTSEKDFWVNDLLEGRDVDVLKVPHHGHDTSSTMDFLTYVKPNLGVISRGKNEADDTTALAESASNNSAYKNLISAGVSIYETNEKDGVSIYATKDNWNLEN